MSTASVYNLHKESRGILKKYRKLPASISIELYPKHFRFKDQNMVFPYESPMKAFLEAVRSQRIPSDLIPALSAAKIPYYEGCLIVELIDHRTRPPPSEASTSTLDAHPSRTSAPPARIVLHPSPGSLWEDICEMNQEVSGGKWDDYDALQLESRVLAATAPPLFLGTSFYATRVANIAVSLTSPSPIVPASCSLNASAAVPRPTKRDIRTTEETEDATWKDRLMHTGEMPKDPRGFQPSFSRLETILAYKSKTEEATRQTAAAVPYSGSGLYQPPATFTNAFDTPNSLPPPSNGYNSNNGPQPIYQNNNGMSRPPSSQQQPFNLQQQQQQLLQSNNGGSASTSVAGTPGPSDEKKKPTKKKKTKKEEQEDGMPSGDPAPVPVKVPGKGHPKTSMKNKPTHPPPPPPPSATENGQDSDTSTISTSTNKKKKSHKAKGAQAAAPPPPPPPIQPKLEDSSSSSAPAKKKQRLNQPLSIPIPPPPSASTFAAAGNGNFQQQQQPTQHAHHQQQQQQVNFGGMPNLTNLTAAQINELGEKRKQLLLVQQQQQMQMQAAQKSNGGKGKGGGGGNLPPELMMGLNGNGFGGQQHWGGQ